MQLSPLEGAVPTFGAKTLEDFDVDHAAPGERIKGSNRQYVRFFKETVQEVYSTKVKINEKTGATQILEQSTRPRIWEMVHIKTPGDTNEVVAPVEDAHKREHFRQYKAYREGRSAPLGKSVEDCNFISQTVATELRVLGVYTVEQLADAPDILCECRSLANGFELREFARAEVKAAQANQNLSQMNGLKSELIKSQELIAKLQSQVAGLVDSRGLPLEAAKVKKPGRPKKHAKEEVESNEQTL